ncbi:MAG: DUF4198 domain-containing protein [Pseudomonadaceae bacterium]|nr:nickel transport complex, nikm subunit, transmembrane [Stutzerimonas stutzeri TS44]
MPIKQAGLALLLAAAAAGAHAHVPFLKPNQFTVEHDRFQVESSFTEFPFQADFAMDSPGFAVVAPDGSLSAITPSAKTKAAVYLQPQLDREGSYRITTGVRKGPIYKAVETAEARLYFSDDIAHHQGVPTSLAYFSRADVYVGKGATAYAPRFLNEGVEIIPLSSPHQLVKGVASLFQVLRDGQPVAGARVIVVADGEHFRKHRIGDLYDVENRRSSNIVADAQGKFSFTPQYAGLNYLLVTIHQKINRDLWHSHNAALTLEVSLAAESIRTDLD